MGVFKAVLRSDAVRRPLCWLGAQYIRFVHLTSRWEVVGGESPAPYWEREEPFILAFWHGRIMMMPYCWPRGRPIQMLISGHRDGMIIARTVKHLGIDAVAGSTTKGGGNALRIMLKTLKRGVSVGITPDAPRGPYMRASSGIGHAARLSGAAVIPVAFATSRSRRLDSWDRFVVAWPFSRGVFVWGPAITVASDADEAAMEMARLAIEKSLNAATVEADTRMGHVPLTPAEPAS